MEIKVECYSGVEYAESPRRFFWQGTWRRVDRILAESRTAGGKQFALLDEAGEKFRLTYQVATDCWTIQTAG